MLRPLSYCLRRSLASLFRSAPVIRAPFFSTAICPSGLVPAGDHALTADRSPELTGRGLDSSARHADARSPRECRTQLQELSGQMTDSDHENSQASAIRSARSSLHESSTPSGSRITFSG